MSFKVVFAKQIDGTDTNRRRAPRAQVHCGKNGYE